MIRFVAKEELAILEADAGGAQSMTIRVLEVVHPDRSESGRAWSIELLHVPVMSEKSNGLTRRGDGSSSAFLPGVDAVGRP